MAIRVPYGALVLVLLLGATDLRAQDTPRASVSDTKSPATARLIGVLPGAGHIYAGETGRGLAYVGGMLGVLAIGTLALATECYSSTLGSNDCDSAGTENVVTAAFLGLWGWSIYDAGRAAHRTNARRRFSVSMLVAPGPTVHARARKGSGVTVGLSIVTR